MIIPKSIRWRLPLSYAAIALLATLALGGVLLTTLHRYYSNLERDYLERNAQNFARTIEFMYADGIPLSGISVSVDNYAFASRARVRLLDENQAVLGDSGSYHGFDFFTLSVAELPENQGTVDESTYIVGGTTANPDHIITLERPPMRGDWVSSLNVDGQAPPNVLFAMPANPDDESIQVVEFARPARSYTMWIAGSPFVAPQASNRNLEEMEVGRLSDQLVTHAIQDQQGKIIGYVELSEGPAYGTEIVDSVAQGLLGAGLIAVLLAVGVGWIISRNISQPILKLTTATEQMANGELSTRVALDNRQDEIGILSHTFNEMAGRVENTVVTLKRFVADAAHELNTPITALQTNLELAASEPNPKFIRQAQAQLTRLASLTNSLLHLARLESNGTAIHRQPINLNQLVRQVHELYASSAEQRGIMLEVDMLDNSLHIQADEQQLMRVLDNLLDNALKFTAEGGKIVLKICQQDQQIMISVQDTGIGILQEDLPELFSRFHRGRNAASYPGNGLGLVITKTIIEQHGGHIQVESQSGSTRFDVQLPMGIFA